MNICRLKTIAVDAISSDYRWSLHQDLSSAPQADIVESVAQFGIIHPPFVRERTCGSYEIVCGTIRMRAWLEVGKRKEIICQVLQPSVAKETLLLLVMEDQKLSGPLSVIEKARFAVLCEQSLATDLARQVMTKTGIGSFASLQRHRSLLALEEPILEAIHSGLISDKTGHDFITMSADDRLFLLDLFDRISLNCNKQRRLIDMGRTVISYENSSFCELISSDYPEFLPGHTIDNIPQATQTLLKDLYQRNHPMSSGMEKQFNNKIKGMKLPEHCSVTHSPAFEKDSISLIIDFKNLNELMGKWQEFRQLLAKKPAAPK